MMLLGQCQFLNTSAFGPVPHAHGRCVLCVITIRVNGDQIITANARTACPNRGEHECCNFMLMVDKLNFGVRNQIIDDYHAASSVRNDWFCWVHHGDVLPANHI